MPEPVHVCCCGDASVSPGLHVALGSAARSLAAGAELRVVVIDLGLGPTEAAKLRETLRAAGKPFTFEMVDANLASLGDTGALRRFYGSLAPYAKLLLAELLPNVGRLIFLDTDTVVCTDLLALFNYDLGNCLGGFVNEGPVSQAFEGEYFLRQGLLPSEQIFNSGVMLLDLDCWRKEQVTARCAELIHRDGSELLSADQTVLNVVLHGRTLALPARFNRLAYPTSPPVHPQSADGIYHLVGRPKPWEPLGELFSRQAELFIHHLDETTLKGWRSWHHLGVGSIWRMARLSRSYWRALTRRVKQ